MLTIDDPELERFIREESARTGEEPAAVLRRLLRTSRRFDASEPTDDGEATLLDEGHLASAAISPGQVTDVYLLALARGHGARLATFDRRIPADAVRDGAASLAVIAA